MVLYGGRLSFLCFILLGTRLAEVHITDLQTGRPVPLLRVQMKSWSLDKEHSLLIQRFLLLALQIS